MVWIQIKTDRISPDLDANCLQRLLGEEKSAVARKELKRSALAVNCCIIIHLTEFSCEDHITSVQRELFIFFTTD